MTVVGALLVVVAERGFTRAATAVDPITAFEAAEIMMSGAHRRRRIVDVGRGAQPGEQF